MLIHKGIYRLSRDYGFFKKIIGFLINPRLKLLTPESKQVESVYDCLSIPILYVFPMGNNHICLAEALHMRKHL